MTQTDKHGQPKNILFARSRLVDRNIDELIGICKGVLFDGIAVQEEAEMMLAWMETNRAAANKWPTNILYARINEMLEDGHLDLKEQGELLDLLMQVTGPAAHIHDVHSTSTTLPLTEPPSEIFFSDKLFCVTGKFYYGTRNEVTSVIQSLGGIAKTKPTKKTDYLVIGDVGSRDWIHSTFGRKIEKAIEYNAEGSAITIVSEEHWASFIK